MKDPVGSVSQLVMNIFKEIGADAYPMNAFAITSTNFIDARGLQDQSDLDKYLEERPTQPSEKKLLASEALKKNLKNIDWYFKNQQDWTGSPPKKRKQYENKGKITFYAKPKSNI